MTESARFKRMVLALPQSKAGSAAVEASVELAALLKLDILGAFVEGLELEKLTGLSLRELRPTGGWQPLEAGRLAHDSDIVAQTVQRAFEMVAKRRAGSRPFQFVRAVQESAVLSQLQPSDIFTLLEPSHPAERIARQFTALVQGAFGGQSALMLMPMQPAAKGPIVAAAAGAADPALAQALAIAASLREKLVILPLRDEGEYAEISRLAAEANVAVEFVQAVGHGILSSSLVRVSQVSKARLIVIARDVLGPDVSLQFAATNRATLLLM